MSMTVFDNFKSRSVDEFAEWLDEYCMFDYAPWMNWYYENYCKKCEPEIIDNSSIECCWCELHDNCNFFQHMDSVPDNKQIIKMWLESECQI